MQFGVSTSYNAEAEDHSSSDWRIGAEFAMVKNRFYFAAEGYYMNMHFTEIMHKDKDSEQDSEKRRLRRMSDILPVSMQDFLYSRKSDL